MSDVAIDNAPKIQLKSEIIEEDEWKKTFLNISSVGKINDSEMIRSGKDKEGEVTYLNIPIASNCSDETTLETKKPETLNRTSEPEYFIGDIVWVNLKRQPLWPGIICYPQQETLIKKYSYKSFSRPSSEGPVRYHVQFFCNNYSTIWVYSTAVFFYEGSHTLAPYIEKLKSSVCTQTVTTADQNIKSFSKMSSLLTFQAKHRKAMQWYKAIKQADICLALKRCERMEIFKGLIKLDREKGKVSEVARKSDSKRGQVTKEDIVISELQSSENIKIIHSNLEIDVEDTRECYEGRDRQPDVKAKFFKGSSPIELVLRQQLETSAFPKVILRRLKQIYNVRNEKSGCNQNKFVIKEENQELQNIRDLFSEEVKKVYEESGKDVENIRPKFEERDRQPDVRGKFSEDSTLEKVVLKNELQISESSGVTSQCLAANNQKESLFVASHKENEEEDSKTFKYFDIDVSTDRKDSVQSHVKYDGRFKCDYCDYSCQAKYTMKRHSLIHSVTKRFKCFECDYETNYKTNLRIHLRIHSDSKLYKCTECDYECNQKGSMKLHLLTQHKKSYKHSECDTESSQNNSIHSECDPESTQNNSIQNLTKQFFECDLCEFLCRTKCSMKRHSLTHSDSNLFKCFECEYVTNFKSNLKLHLFKHSNSKLFKCSECDYESNQKGSLKLHLYKHSNSKRFKCSECGYECNQIGSLKLHFLKHSNTKLFKCFTCDYKCNLKSTLKLHLLMHSEQKVLKCLECNYQTNHKGNLKLHISRIHSNTRLLRCSECDYECNQKCNLKNHIKETHIKWFECATCSYKAKRKSLLKCHLLTHSTPKVLECSKCSYKSIHKLQFKSHLLTHSNAYLFECSKCDFKSKFKFSLKRHLSIHSKFECSECSYKCARKDNLGKHLLTHSNTHMLECSECTYKSDCKDNLEKHLLTHSNTHMLECSECTYKSDCKDNLEKHLLTHSNTHMLECSECTYKSDCKSKFRLHLLKHKSEKEDLDDDPKIKTELREEDIKVEIHDVMNECEETECGDFDDIENYVNYN